MNQKMQVSLGNNFNSLVANLYIRWKHEKEYEDFKEYQKVFSEEVVKIFKIAKEIKLNKKFEGSFVVRDVLFSFMVKNNKLYSFSEPK